MSLRKTNLYCAGMRYERGMGPTESVGENDLRVVKWSVVSLRAGDIMTWYCRVECCRVQIIQHCTAPAQGGRFRRYFKYARFSEHISIANLDACYFSISQPLSTVISEISMHHLPQAVGAPCCVPRPDSLNHAEKAQVFPETAVQSCMHMQMSSRLS